MSMSKFNSIRCFSKALTLEALLNNLAISRIDPLAKIDWSFIEK
jgi:hypothetical protein